MIPALASNTLTPAQSDTGSVNRPAVVDRHRVGDGDAVGLAHLLVLGAEAGGRVDDAGALGGVHEVAGQHPEGLGAVGEEVEQRDVAAAHQFSAATVPTRRACDSWAS